MDITTVVRLKIREYINLLTELKRLIPPYGPNRFGDAMLIVVRAMGDFYEMEMENILETDDDPYVEQISVKYLKILQKLHTHPIQFLQSGNEYFVPSEILMTMTRYVNQLGDKDIGFSIIPQWEYMYGVIANKDIVKYFLRDIAVDPMVVERLQENQPELFVFITYPYVEHRNILLHSIIIHELGHLVDLIHGITGALESDIIFHQDSFNDCLKREIPLSAGTISSEEIPGESQITVEDIIRKQREVEFKYECIEVVRKWLKEIVADIISIRSLGPAYLFAVSEFTAIINVMDNYSPSHPSSRLRMKFLLEELDELNYFTNLKNPSILEKLVQLKSLVDAGQIVEPNKSAQIVAYKTIINNIDLIRERVMSLAPYPLAYTYSVDTFNRDVHEYVKEYLSKGIPQADKWDSEGNYINNWNIVSILNAGWQLYLTDMDAFYTLFGAESIEDKNRVFNNLLELIIRAMETSQIQDMWRLGED